MAGSLITTANLAMDSGFRARTQAAMMIAALNVASEAQAAGGQDSGAYNLRHTLAWQILTTPGAYLDRFAWSTAANATVSGDVLPPVAISSSTAANPSVITTAAVHGLATGDVVEIAGHAVNTAVNGTWPVTVLTATTFSVPALGNSAGGATGTMVRQPPDADIQNAVNAAFSDIAGVGVTT